MLSYYIYVSRPPFRPLKCFHQTDEDALYILYKCNRHTNIFDIQSAPAAGWKPGPQNSPQTVQTARPAGGLRAGELFLRQAGATFPASRLNRKSGRNASVTDCDGMRLAWRCRRKPCRIWEFPALRQGENIFRWASQPPMPRQRLRIPEVAAPRVRPECGFPPITGA